MVSHGSQGEAQGSIPDDLPLVSQAPETQNSRIELALAQAQLTAGFGLFPEAFPQKASAA